MLASFDNSLDFKTDLSPPEVPSKNLAVADRSCQDKRFDCDWRIVDLTPGTEPLSLDQAIRADEAILVVSPQHWQRGCQYIEALFHRFVDAQLQSSRNEEVRKRVLDLSVVCSGISDIPQGFKIFGQVEARTHKSLDMQEPGFDIRLHYLGGVLNDPENILRADEAGSPLITFQPSSPAAHCMTHIAHSILKPVMERDPRTNLQEVTYTRLPEEHGLFEYPGLKRLKNWGLFVVLGLVSIFFLSQSARNFPSSFTKVWQTYGGIESARRETPREMVGGKGALLVSQGETETQEQESVLPENGTVISPLSGKVRVENRPLHGQRKLSQRAQANRQEGRIPNQKYDITIYRSPGFWSCAVLFAIPHGGMDVIMKHTTFTEKVGTDLPTKYIDIFKAHPEGYRTAKITDQDGNVRGYLMISNSLDYLVQRDERTMVWVSPLAER